MMSGDYIWHTGTLYGGGTHGFFWASTLYSYTYSRGLYFDSSNVNPKNVSYKPYGMSLRCVAQNPYAIIKIAILVRERSRILL